MIGIGLTIYFMEVDNELVGCIVAVITFFSLVFLFLVPMEIPNGKTSYVIEINEAIDYNEFYEKYKVIDHYEYTNIYVVEEK